MNDAIEKLGILAKRGNAAALTALERCAANGQKAAQYELGFMYAYGEGVERDEGRAVQFLQSADEQEDWDNRVIKQLAVLAREGSTEAVTVLEEYAAKGNG